MDKQISMRRLTVHWSLLTVFLLAACLSPSGGTSPLPVGEGTGVRAPIPPQPPEETAPPMTDAWQLLNDEYV